MITFIQYFIKAIFQFSLVNTILCCPHLLQSFYVIHTWNCRGKFSFSWIKVLPRSVIIFPITLCAWIKVGSIIMWHCWWLLGYITKLAGSGLADLLPAYTINWKLYLWVEYIYGNKKEKKGRRKINHQRYMCVSFERLSSFIWNSGMTGAKWFFISL